MGPPRVLEFEPMGLAGIHTLMRNARYAGGGCNAVARPWFVPRSGVA